MPDDEKVHPLFVGKTPLELEEMSYADLDAHIERVRAYLRKVDQELLIHFILEKDRASLHGYPHGATAAYKRAWEIAQKRKRAGT